MQTKKKAEKQPKLKGNQWNELSGKDLVDMGKIIDSNGFLIATTLKYNVWVKPGKWEIFQAE